MLLCFRPFMAACRFLWDHTLTPRPLLDSPDRGQAPFTRRNMRHRKWSRSVALPADGYLGYLTLEQEFFFLPGHYAIGGEVRCVWHAWFLRRYRNGVPFPNFSSKRHNRPGTPPGETHTEQHPKATGDGQGKERVDGVARTLPTSTPPARRGLEMGHTFENLTLEVRRSGGLEQA
jgi:hypothetical protein